MEVARDPGGPSRQRLAVAVGRTGDPDGPAIVCLHGYSDSSHSFDRVLPFFSPVRRVFAFSQRGHGDSDKPECCYGVDDYAAEVLAFMDAVGIDRATLVGHSGGTLIAARAALDHPERVSGMVLIGSAIVGSRNPVMVELGEAGHALVDPVPPDFAREFQESTVHTPLPAEFLELVVAESLKLPVRVWHAYVDGVILGPGPALGCVATETSAREALRAASRRPVAATSAPRTSCSGCRGPAGGW